MDRLISEKSLLDKIDEWKGFDTVTIRLSTLRNIVKAIPSAEPKTVEYTGDGYADGEMVYDMANCPRCNYEFEESELIWGCKFCPECGQALDWGLDNAEED